jgi:hypothetical protein
MTGANSAVGLRSMPVRYLFLDEVDGYPIDVDGEGNAVALAEARTRTFARRKIFIVSTPTIAGVSTIEREYEASDQRRYFVPCPHCGHRQWLRFEQLRWERGENGNFPDTAAYVCESCEVPIPEHHKTWMLEHGEWRAMADGGNTVARPAFTCRACTARLAGAVGKMIAAAWESAISKEAGSPPRSRPSRTPNSVRRGSRKAKRPTGSACWNAARTTDRFHPDRWPAADGRCRRAEGSHRSLHLGLRSWQGILAGRASRADGRYRPRRGVEITGRVLR